MKKKDVYLSLGTNIGDKEWNLLKAIILIEKTNNIEVVKISKLYETEPVGYTDQDIFVNCAIKIKTTLVPYKLLKEINRIEHEMGRVRLFRWGPRCIDIDMIFYDNISIKRNDLTIPHKEYKNRNFVLYPLIDICDYKYLKMLINTQNGGIKIYNSTKKILVSSCLLGFNSKYNGGNNQNSLLVKLTNKFNLLPFCPEQAGGMNTPRKPVEILDGKVFDQAGNEFTKEFIKAQNEALMFTKLFNIKYAILKSKSPSCGYGDIYDGTFTRNIINGNGYTARILEKNGTEIISI